MTIPTEMPGPGEGLRAGDKLRGYVIYFTEEQRAMLINALTECIAHRRGSADFDALSALRVHVYNAPLIDVEVGPDG